MKKLLQSIFSSHRNLFRRTGLVCFAFFLMLLPARSFAQCEPEGAALTAAATIVGLEEAAIMSQMVPNLQAFWEYDLDTLRMQLGVQDQKDWTKMFAALNTWWSRWFPDLKSMTAQLSAGIVDQTEKLGSINDASNILAAAQDEQKERIKAKLTYQPTDQACRFDTQANYLAQDRAIGEALEKGLEWDFVSVANNEFGSLAQNGPADLQRQRWDIYVKNFCDYQAEDCDSGCSPPGGSGGGSCTAPAQGPAHKNMDIYVSKMLFKDETLPVQDRIALQALQSMMFNVTGFKVPDPIVSGAIDTSPGIDQIFVRREYMAQMSAVGSLLYSIVGDRIQGVKGPTGMNDNGDNEATKMRKMMGIKYATDKPSVREVRQSIIEQLWDPNFYKNLGDSPAAISQKELYLRAYGLTMLYDIISKQEKISTAYAIETANLLKGTLGAADSSKAAPLSGGW